MESAAPLPPNGLRARRYGRPGLLLPHVAVAKRVRPVDDWRGGCVSSLIGRRGPAGGRVRPPRRRSGAGGASGGCGSPRLVATPSARPLFPVGGTGRTGGCT